MCDRYSIAVRVDGEYAHVPSNSHSEAAEKAGWKENDTERRRFYEAEWDGQGEYPGAKAITRGLEKGEELPDKVRQTIDSVYRAIASVLADPSAFPQSRFTGPEWADIRRDIARNPNTPAETLVVLPKDEDAGVRYWVARNPNSPAEALVILSKDKNSGVRRGVARNPNTPAETLVVLSKDEVGVRYGVARNPNTPAETLVVLSKDEDAGVRHWVARNPNIPATN